MQIHRATETTSVISFDKYNKIDKIRGDKQDEILLAKVANPVGQASCPVGRLGHCILGCHVQWMIG